MRMGLREANQRFAAAIRAVRAGERVVLTDRGEPIAVIMPLRDRRAPDDRLARLAAAGLVRLPARVAPMPPARPPRAKGRPLSKIVSEERDRW